MRRYPPLDPPEYVDFRPDPKVMEAYRETLERIPERRAVIRKLLARKAPISGGRRLGQVGGRETIVGGRTEEQIIAANVDTAFFRHQPG